MTTPQEDRIIRAKTAVEAYAAVSGYKGGALGASFDEVISDLIADLAHLAGHLVDENDEPLDIFHLVECGLRNYNYEKEEDNA